MLSVCLTLRSHPSLGQGNIWIQIALTLCTVHLICNIQLWTSGHLNTEPPRSFLLSGTSLCALCTCSQLWQANANDLRITVGHVGVLWGGGTGTSFL